MAQRYQRDFTRIARYEWGLDAPVAALAAQIHQESGWNPRAVSRVGAAGMAQFMPATAQWWCEVNQIAPEDCQPANPQWAMHALVGYDRWLYVRIPPVNACDRMWATLKAYNGGLGHVLSEARKAHSFERHALDAACGTARRSPTFCPENNGYPHRILMDIQPRYAGWGGFLTC